MPVYRAVLVGAISLGCTYIALLSDREGIHRPLTFQSLELAGVFSFVQIATLLLFGLHRCHWHLLSIEEVPNIVGMSLTATLFGVLGVLAAAKNEVGIVAGSDFVLHALLLIGSIVLVQMTAVAISRSGHTESTHTNGKRVVIYGADEAGVGISSDLRRLGTRYRLVGFVDAREAMRGIQIAGGHVLGADSDIRKLVDIYRVDEVLISSVSMRSKSGQSFVRHCRSESVDFRIIPSIDSGSRARSEAKRSSAAAYL